MALLFSLNDGSDPPVLKSDGLSNDGKLYLLSSLAGYLFSFVMALQVIGFESVTVLEFEFYYDFSSCCLSLYFSLLIKFSICLGLILLATKYRGCLFFRYSMVSFVSLSAFNCLNFILRWYNFPVEGTKYSSTIPMIVNITITYQ